MVRSLNDLGLAAWFGGTLAGAVGINGAAADVEDRTQRLHVANSGWARWAPVNLAAIGAYVVGGTGLLIANKGRTATQKGVGAASVAGSKRRMNSAGRGPSTAHTVSMELTTDATRPKARPAAMNAMSSRSSRRS